MRPVFWLAIAAIAVASLPVHSETDPPTSASVRLIVCSTYGDHLQDAQVTLTNEVTGERFTAVAGEAELDCVQFGVYDLEARLAGFMVRKERLYIDQPGIVFRIGLELAPNHFYHQPKLSGSIKPQLKGRRDLWVRLAALYSSDLVENAVDASGNFELDGMAPGKYILLLFQKDKLLSTQPVEILGGKQSIEVTWRR